MPYNKPFINLACSVFFVQKRPRPDISLYRPSARLIRGTIVVLELIQNENSVLKNENEFLRERLEVMTYTLSDLNNQIKSKDQEKESLLTAIRLIYDDSKIKSSDAALHGTSNVEESLEGNNEAYQTIHNKRKQPNVNKSALATAAL